MAGLDKQCFTTNAGEAPRLKSTYSSSGLFGQMQLSGSEVSTALGRSVQLTTFPHRYPKLNHASSDSSTT